MALPPAAIARIAAGETIDSPAAAVRELIDNALDAGATRLDLTLDLDRGFLRLADNGAGMDRANLERAALAHATSKIRDRADLDRIITLGFRGEALYSLAQLADLAIASRTADGTGWQVRYDHGGQPTAIAPVPLAPGTVVTVADLFSQWAARRAGLPAIAKQYQQVQMVIWRAALCHPGVGWQVWRRDRPWFSLAPSDGVVGRLCQGIREARSGDFQTWTGAIALPDLSELQPAVEESEAAIAPPPPHLSLTIGLPDRLHRHRPDWLHVAVNGRRVNAPEIERALYDAFGQTLPRHRHPVALAHLRLPPGWIDWNRTPAKDEIYLRDAPHWANQVRQAVEQTLANLDAAPAGGLYGPPRVRQLVRAAEATGTYGFGKLTAHPLSDRLPAADPDPQNPENSDSADTGPPLPTHLKAIAQLHNTYLVAESPDGIWLIEQHIAHERVLFEELRDRWQLVPLDPPLVLEHLSERDRGGLQTLGIEPEAFGENLWAIRQIPAPLRDRADQADALRELARAGNLNGAQVAIACRTAIRNGTPLDRAAQQTLLDHWQRTRNPRTCPHGRPIYLPLEETALARFFRRHWVIGKSHGL
jgi:DNA mismatch repair protein MutL